RWRPKVGENCRETPPERPPETGPPRRSLGAGDSNHKHLDPTAPRKPLPAPGKSSRAHAREGRATPADHSRIDPPRQAPPSTARRPLTGFGRERSPGTRFPNVAAAPHPPKPLHFTTGSDGTRVIGLVVGAETAPKRL